MRPRLLVLALSAIFVLSPSLAVAERPLRGSFLAGGYLGVTGPDNGGELLLNVLPGSSFERLGLRLHARSFGARADGFVAAGVTFEAAAARPRLAMNLFAEIGVTDGARVVTGAGVQTTLWVIGPLALGTEGAGHLFWQGVDTTLGLSASLLLGFAL